MRLMFTEETWHSFHQLQAIRYGEALQSQEIDLYMTKLIQDPISVMQYKVDKLLGYNEEDYSVYDQLKMVIYDGHDFQAVMLLKWLDASNLEYPHPTEYATQISFELLYSSECLSSATASEECFAVQVMYNGTPLEFADVCKENPKLCSYKEFIDNIESKSYRGPHADELVLACDTSIQQPEVPSLSPFNYLPIVIALHR